MSTSVAEKRPLGALGRMGMVAGLHAGALYLIASSLEIVPPLIKEPPIVTRFIEEVRPPEDPVDTVDPPNMVQPRITIPHPDIPDIDTAPPQDAIFGEIVRDPPEVTELPPPARQALLVGVRQDARYPLTQPNYPAKDIRENNEGSVELEVYVLPNGRVGDVRVLRSTGSASLDQSAIDEAKRRWRLLPATRDGEPYAQWHRLKVTFSLQDR